MRMELAIGIDIGGTKTKIGLVDKEGNCVEHTFFRTKEFPDLDEYLRKVVSIIEELKAKLPDSIHIIGCGIGAPNASSRHGTIVNASNLAWKGTVHFRDKLGGHLPIPLKLMNDASAAALGEMHFGNAKGMSDFIVITLGTGFGSGIVANGKLIEGFDGFAGELGHIDMTLGDGRVTGLNVRGGLEAYVSATGLKRTILYMLCMHLDESRFRGIAYNDLHGEDITKAAEEGDPIALKAFDYTADVLGLALANFTAFTQPEAFFLLGGLVSSGKFILEPLETYFEDYLLDIYKGKVKLLLSGLPKETAAMSGAASLIWDDETLQRGS
jgi:glucokinase